MKLNVIGDSHTSIFSFTNTIPPTDKWHEYEHFRVLHVGAITAYNICNNTSIFNQCKAILKNESILLSFGEIDCRCRVDREPDKYENIDLIIDRYFTFIKSIENKNIICMGIVPCLVETPFSDWFAADKSRSDIFISTRGTLAERNSYKQYFNFKLE